MAVRWHEGWLIRVRISYREQKFKITKTKMTDRLLLKDELRCDNHRCAKRMKCCRYLQVEIDKKDLNVFQEMVVKFEEKECKKYIENDDNS